MYIANLRRLCDLEIDKPTPLNTLIWVDLLPVIILCGAHALSYINATGMKLACMFQWWVGHRVRMVGRLGWSLYSYAPTNKKN